MNYIFKSIFFLTIFIFKIAGDEKFVLLTTLYEERNSARQAEYLHVLHKNLNNPLIKLCLVFFEKDSATEFFLSEILRLSSIYKNLEIVTIDERPTYDVFFRHANKFYENQKIIVSNADIYFDESLSLIEKKDLKDSFLALTRWDSDSFGFFHLKDKDLNNTSMFSSVSQDSWIFLSPIKNIKADLKVGFLGCDNSLAYNAIKAGYLVLNPSISIKSFHVHQSNIRNYTEKDRVYNDGFYSAVVACTWKKCLCLRNRRNINQLKIDNSFEEEYNADVHQVKEVQD